MHHTGANGDAAGAFVTFPHVGQGGSLHVRIQRAPIQITVCGREGESAWPLTPAPPPHTHTNTHTQIKSAWIDHTELRVEAPPSAPALEVTETKPTGGEPGAVVVSDARLNFAPNALLGETNAAQKRRGFDLKYMHSVGRLGPTNPNF
jgi:hypothetical protein